MKKYIQNQKGKNIFKNLRNKRKYTKRNNSIELNENYNEYLSKEKNRHNISDISSFKQIKEIKNISAPNKTFYLRKNLAHNNNTYIPIYLSSMTKTNKYLESLKNLNYNLKLNKVKVISEKSLAKTIYNNNSNNNNNKIFNYSIYLPDEIKDLTFYKKYDLNFPKSKDLVNTKIAKKSFKNTSKFIPNNKVINYKLKINSETNSLINKEYKNISEHNKKYVNIYNPKKIFLSKINNKKKSEDLSEISKELENKEMAKRQFNSLGLSKKQLQNKLYKKTKEKENITFEQKDTSIKKENKIKEELILKNNNRIKELNHSNIIIPKILINNNSTILERKDSIKVYNIDDSNENNKKINLYQTPKIIKKINEDIPKIINFNCDNYQKNKEQDSLNEKNLTFNSIKNGGFFNIKKKINNSYKELNSLINNKNEINEVFIRNKNRFKTSKEVQKQIFIKGINTYNINNKKCLNIMPIKVNKFINDKNNKFLNKIIKRNINKNKNKLLNKKVIKYKKSILLNQINNINKIIYNERRNNSSYEFNSEKELGFNCLEVNEENNLNYENIYSKIKQISILNVLLYSYIPLLKKCVLEKNIINYLLINNSLSSIFVPLVNFTKRRSALFLSDKLFIIQKNITIFEDKKSKFIESKRSKKIFENISLNFINKELFYLHLNSKTNNYSNKGNLTYKSTKKERKIYSFKHITNSYRKNLFNIVGKKSSKKITYFNDNYNNNSITLNKRIQKLSVLQNKNIFQMPRKNKDKIIEIEKRKRRGAVSQENINQRLSTKQSKIYYDLIQYFNEFNEKVNYVVVLKNLIKKGEAFLFLEYLNNNSRKIDINTQDEDGNSFLILSIKHSLNKLSKILLEKGINVNIQNNDGNSALHYALSGKNFYMADILRKYGASEVVVNKLGYTPWDCIGKNIEFDAIY